MNPLEALGDDDTHAEQKWPLCSPIAAGARTVLLPGNDNQRHLLRTIPFRSVKNSHEISNRVMPGKAPLPLRSHLVFDADIGKRAAHHHVMIAAP